MTRQLLVQNYIQKPQSVEAVFVTRRNMANIANWGSPFVTLRMGAWAITKDDPKGFYLSIHNPAMSVSTCITDGMYLIKFGKEDFRAMNKELFESMYELVEKGAGA